MSKRAREREIGKSMRRGWIASLAASTFASACLFGPGSALAAGGLTPASPASFGSSGSGAGQIGNAIAVAVNDSSGDVYVADSTNNRVEQFSATGSFIRTWGNGVNATSGGDVCPRTGFPGDACQAGNASSIRGGFKQVVGIGVDNSTGGAAGNVYVLDGGNNRVQEFSSEGAFVLMWGLGVNSTSAGNVCPRPGNPGDACVAGGTSGQGWQLPITTSAPGVFAGWNNGGKNPNGHSLLGVDGNGQIYVGDREAGPHPRVQKFDSDGTFVSMVGPSREIGVNDYPLITMDNIAVDSAGDTFASDYEFARRFPPSSFTATGQEFGYDTTYLNPSTSGGSKPQSMAVDPYNEFLFIADSTNTDGTKDANACTAADPSGYHILEYQQSAEKVDCTNVKPMGVTSTAGMAIASSHELYAASGSKVYVFNTPVAIPPGVGPQSASEITSNKAVAKTTIAANLDSTTYHVEYGTSPCSSNPCTSTSESNSIGASFSPKPVSADLTGLDPSTTYYYRFVATNAAGAPVAGPDLKFTTFAENPPFDSSCDNNLARQQTGAGFLSDCRAYELVSAADQGGYDVESDLVPGQMPFGGYPQADGKVLYGVHNGAIPGAGKPTNRGVDPYVATRDAGHERWDTEYVGIPADAPSEEPFSSTPAGADSDLESFAFGGSKICRPCFVDSESGEESTGIPVRLPSGELTQGMVGSEPVAEPEAAGEVEKPFSADGNHLVFGSEQKFEPTGNEENGNVTIYERDLQAGTTEVVSTLPDGSTIEASDEVAELDVSNEGERVLIGVEVGEEGGNKRWHLYIHEAGNPDSIDLTESTAEGALYDGMTADGSMVFFTSRDNYADDTDESADIFRADVEENAATLTRVSTGEGGTGDVDTCDPAGNSYNSEDWNVVPGGPTDCSAVAVGGGGGVASGNGRIYFLSPELLDTAAVSEGTAGAPNQYLSSPGSSPRYVATLESAANTPLKPASHGFKKAFGSFENPDGVAIDPVTGSTYVLDNLSTEESPGAFVQKFDASGHIDTSFGTNGKIDGTGSPTGKFLEYGAAASYGEYGAPLSIAVDPDPSSPSYRDIYVPDMFNGVIDKFGPNGNYISQIEVGDLMLSVAIDTHGNVYATGLFGGAYVYDSSGNQINEFGIAFFTFQDIAANSSGEMFVANGTETKLYDPSGTFVETFVHAPSYGVRVDPSDDHVYVDEGTEVVEFSPAGEEVGLPIGSGELHESVGLGVEDGRLVVSNRGGGDVLEFGQPVTPSDRGYDSPLAIDSVREPATRRTADFQTTPTADYAVFTAILPLTGFDSAGHYEVFRYDAGGERVQCVSCNPTGNTPTTDAGLASNGLSIDGTGRVFFNSGEPLVLRDANSKGDVYEWENGPINLISSGKDSNGSSLLSVSADGTDAYFFTREKLAPNDRNASLVRIYDAREGGGFFVIPPPAACKASDECHGPGSPEPAPLSINTNVSEVRGNLVSCHRNQVRRHGQCVRKPRRHRPHKRRHRGRKHHRPPTRRHG
jgi:hypothetical protein